MSPAVPDQPTLLLYPLHPMHLLTTVLYSVLSHESCCTGSAHPTTLSTPSHASYNYSILHAVYFHMRPAVPDQPTLLHYSYPPHPMHPITTVFYSILSHESCSTGSISPKLSLTFSCKMSAWCACSQPCILGHTRA